MEQIIRFLGGKGLFRFLVLTLASYILMERLGIFSAAPASLREIFHSIPVRAVSVVIAINAAVALASLRGGRRAVGPLLFYLSVITLPAALWVSIYTRFEGKAIIAEGQTFTGYVQETIYRKKESRLPELGITILKIHTEGTPDMKGMKEVKADILYAGRTTGGVLNGKLSSSWPLISDWTMVRITDFGYAPRYVIYDQKEQELESMFVYMSLFPAGKEDHFETWLLGYLFYLKCYPDYVEEGGKPATASLYPRNPMFHLRIVRNKDIVYNGLLKPSEKVRFDNLIIAAPEVKMWVEMSFVRDLGLPVAALGLALMASGALLMLRRKERNEIHGDSRR